MPASCRTFRREFQNAGRVSTANDVSAKQSPRMQAGGLKPVTQREEPMSRRANNEGSIHKRERDGRWVATILVGYAPSGKPIRKTYVKHQTGRGGREAQGGDET